MADYSYQPKTANKLLLDCQKSEAAVLAAAPGSGKTVISHIFIEEYIKKHPNANVLVLTHGQNVLKNQYIESLDEGLVAVSFTYGEFGSDNQVQIGLPQSIKKCSFDNVDLLVVDECHEFYLKPMVQAILADKKPSHQLLMTGSPSQFNLLKKQGAKYAITYISGSELLDNDVFSDVDMDVVRVNYRNNARESMAYMLDHAQKKGKNLSKIMVAVKTISEANNVSYYLNSIGRKVAVSNSKNDKKNMMVKNFKKGLYDTLIVVQRGILGFSDNNITGLFDLRCSNNVDISNQLFARVLRKHPDNIEKFYYRAATKDKKQDFKNQVIMLHKVRAMMRKDIFRNYDGENMTVTEY